jgi:transposase
MVWSRRCLGGRLARRLTPQTDAALARLPVFARHESRLNLVDPTQELAAAWGVKEQLRRLLHTATVEAACTEKMILGCYVVAAGLDETWRALGHHRHLVACDRSTHAHRRHQCPHRGGEHRIKQVKRTGRGYRNPAHYQARILLTSDGTREG